MSGPSPFALGDAVTVEVDLPDPSDEPFSAWGIGNVVRLDGERSAIHLCAGAIEDCSSEPEDPEGPPDAH